MPYWICERCGTRLYSASERLKWRDCPSCSGNLSLERDGKTGRAPSRVSTERVKSARSG